MKWIHTHTCVSTSFPGIFMCGLYSAGRKACIACVCVCVLRVCDVDVCLCVSTPKSRRLPCADNVYPNPYHNIYYGCVGAFGGGLLDCLGGRVRMCVSVCESEKRTQSRKKSCQWRVDVFCARVFGDLPAHVYESEPVKLIWIW